MKKILFTVALLVIATMLSAYVLPPELPSSFYGQVIGGNPDANVTTNLDGSSKTFMYNGKIYYTINVTGGKEGQSVFFYIDGKYAGSGIYHIGSNTNVDLFIFVWRFWRFIPFGIRSW